METLNTQDINISNNDNNNSIDKISQKRFMRLYPWFTSLSDDLIFFIAIDTLFLSTVVGLTNSQIILSTSISLIIRLILQPLILFIIKKIGNTSSVKIGSFLLFLSSIIYTFGKSFIAIIFAKTFYYVAYVFRDMVNVILKNNLEAQNRQNEFKKYRNKSTTIYSIITMILLIVSTSLFNINPYIPMAFCISLTFVCFCLSFLIKEEKISETSSKTNAERKKISFTSFGSTVILAIIAYGLFYAAMTSSQDNGKLFLQNNILDIKTIEITAIIMGVIQFLSRISRIVSNLLFSKISKLVEDKFGCILSFLLIVSDLLIIFGSLLPNFYLKLCVMSAGYIIILFIRDPFKIFIEDFVISHVEKDKRESANAAMGFLYNVLRAIISLMFGFILVNSNFMLEFMILIILAIIELILVIRLYFLAKQKPQTDNSPIKN